MWYVALGWHTMEIAQTSVVLEFYIWFRFWPYHRGSRHVILHQSAKFYPNRTTLSRKKWRHVDFQDDGSPPSWILGGPIMRSLKTPCTTSYRSSIDNVALNCLVFDKVAFFSIWRQTDKQTDRQTNRWAHPSHEAALAVASGGLITIGWLQKCGHFKIPKLICVTSVN